MAEAEHIDLTRLRPEQRVRIERGDEDVDKGLYCVVCGAEFSEEHGEIVICWKCNKEGKSIRYPDTPVGWFELVTN